MGNSMRKCESLYVGKWGEAPTRNALQRRKEGRPTRVLEWPQKSQLLILRGSWGALQVERFREERGLLEKRQMLQRAAAARQAADDAKAAAAAQVFGGPGPPSGPRSSGTCSRCPVVVPNPVLGFGVAGIRSSHSRLKWGRDHGLFHVRA